MNSGLAIRKYSVKHILDNTQQEDSEHDPTINEKTLV